MILFAFLLKRLCNLRVQQMRQMQEITFFLNVVDPNCDILLFVYFYCLHICLFKKIVDEMLKFICGK